LVPLRPFMTYGAHRPAVCEELEVRASRLSFKVHISNLYSKVKLEKKISPQPPTPPPGEYGDVIRTFT